MSKLRYEFEKFERVQKAYRIQYSVVVDLLREKVKKIGPTIVARESGISRQYLHSILNSGVVASFETTKTIVQKVLELSNLFE